MTNETKHTPGDWYVQDNTAQGPHDQLRVDSDNGCVAICARGETVSAELRANAQLIARAPTLLAENETLRQQNAELVAMVRMLIPFSDVTTAGCAATELARDLLNRVQS